MNNLRICVDNSNFEGAKCIEIISMNCFIITNIDRVLIYDSYTFQKVGEIPIILLSSESRERNEVIGIQKSKDEQYLAIISGKNLIKN